MDFKITLTFCNETVTFCNEKAHAISNKLLSVFVLK